MVGWVASLVCVVIIIRQEVIAVDAHCNNLDQVCAV